MSKSIFTGISSEQLGELIVELADPWHARQEGRLHDRRGGRRRRDAGAGRKHQLAFTDRVLVTLAHLRLGLPHQALAVMYGVDRSTVTRAVGEIRPLLAARGFATPTGVRLRTLADVFAYADAEGVELRADGTEIQVRRPQANQPGRRRFVSGKRKQNTVKSTIITDDAGRTVWVGAHRPGRMHDQTAVKTEGIEDLLDRHPSVHTLMDAGYRGLAKAYPDQVIVPPLKPPGTATPQEVTAWETARKSQSSKRICVEHGIAESKHWRSLQRFTARREHLPETIEAIAGLVSDRAAAR